MTPTPWSPDFELEYVRQTSQAELLRRHAEHHNLFGFRALIDALPEGATVMEVGCGAAGGLLGYVPYRFARIAVDPLVMQYPWMPDGFEKREEFAHALSQPDASVDLLICLETLDHCESMEQFGQSQWELARVLKPGGTLLFMLPPRGGPCDAHPCCPNAWEVEQAFHELGLETVRNRFPKEGTWLVMRRL